MENKDLTFEEMKNLSPEEQKNLYSEIKKKRSLAKTVNFASVYGAGAPKIASSSGMSLAEATNLHTVY